MKWAHGLAAASVAAALAVPVSNPDLYWHLRTGSLMAACGAVPRTESFSWTLAGTPWIDFEWLSQLLFHAAFSAAGMWGLWLLKVVLLCAAAVMLWRWFGLYRASLELRAAGLILWSLALLDATDLRPETFSLLLFIALASRLEARRLDSNAGSLSPAALAGVACFFSVWSNLHAGFAFGLALLGLYAAEEWRLGRRSMAWACLAGFVGSLLNPYGPRVYEVLAAHGGDLAVLSRNIQEWTAPDIRRPLHWPLFALLVSSLLATAAHARRKTPGALQRLVVLGIFAVAAGWHVRLASYAAPLAAAWLAWSGANLAPRRARIVLAACAAWAALFCWRVQAPAYAALPASTRQVPEHAASFLAGHRAIFSGRRMLNPWHWGGYLGFRAPELAVFMDNRYLFMPLLRETVEAARDPEAFQEFLQRRGIDYSIVRRGPIRSIVTEEGRESTLPYDVRYYPPESWALVWVDDQALVLARKAAFPVQWLKALSTSATARQGPPKGG